MVCWGKGDSFERLARMWRDRMNVRGQLLYKRVYVVHIIAARVHRRTEVEKEDLSA
ncbi:hypothetical protein BH18ACI4_BH18ACI4_14790 [soil metagenome]